ncbi:MAG: hypothetical protein ABSB80_08590 [Methanoregula sp.]|jgi:uncharacterized membrane protein HdeD (DUF308 family)|uniref:hypothetical protein n=1 Tax=Methanoregula sp. TaxID=2052170 RepID=UPI003D09DB68
MLDAKTSCLLRGFAGVIFGILALLIPEIVLGTFSGLFWVLIGIGIALFLFLAISAKHDESIFWFGMAAALLIIGVISVIFAQFVAILLILIIAAIAIYNGFTDIMLALARPKSKYVLIPVMVISGFVLLAVLFSYFPSIMSDPALSVVGTFALVFGLFSIMLGFYNPDDSDGDFAAGRAACEIPDDRENR